MVDITKILLRRDTKANWESNNPILSEGEPVVAFENNQVVAVKIGVEGKHYSELPNILEDKTDLTEILEELNALNIEINGDPEDLMDEGLVGRVDELSNELENKQGTLTAGDNIQISEENVISATNTTYTAGTNISINDNNEISATDTTYSAGNGIEISEENVISVTGEGTSYVAGEGINIVGGTISTVFPEAPIESGSYILKCLVDEQKLYFWEKQTDHVLFKVGINAENYTVYEAEENMTWASFIDSNFNRGNAFRAGSVESDQVPNQVYNGYGDEVTDSGTPVTLTDTIEEDKLYIIV